VLKNESVAVTDEKIRGGIQRMKKVNAVIKSAQL
jgi:hypothetical protein